MACRILAKKSCSSHLFGVVPSRNAQTAFVPELSKDITFLSYILSWWNCKTRVIPRTFNGFQKVYFWCSLLEVKAKFGECATHVYEKQYFTPVLTCPNLSTKQWPCTFIAWCHFLHFQMLLLFSIMFYPAETAYLSFRDRELSNDVRLVQLRWR